MLRLRADVLLHGAGVLRLGVDVLQLWAEVRSIVDGIRHSWMLDFRVGQLDSLTLRL
jgi:hypothetical protein